MPRLKEMRYASFEGKEEHIWERDFGLREKIIL